MESVCLSNRSGGQAGAWLGTVTPVTLGLDAAQTLWEMLKCVWGAGADGGGFWQQ